MLSALKRKIGVRLVLVAAIALASFVLSSIAGIWRIHNERAELEASILREGQSVISLLSGSMSHMAMAYDYTNLEEISARIVQHPAIARVAIISAKGKPMATANGESCPINVRTLKQPLLFDGKAVGEIEIDLDLDKPNALFRKKVIAILYEQALATLLLAVVLNFILSVLIARPIVTLRQHMLDSVDREESDGMPPLMKEKGLLEFRDMAGVFNNLLRSVHSYQTRLREKIDLANRDLHDVNIRLQVRAGELEQKTADLQKALALVEQLATTDALTGSYNRRAFEQFFDHEISKHQRYERPATLALIDLDYFKEVNDNFGHAAGDLVLREVANTIRRVVRESDIFARLGGDEFAIILPETSIEVAQSVVRKIMVAIDEHRFEFEGERLRVGLSIGLAGFSPDFRASRIMTNADAATYHSKKNGRHRASFCLCEDGGVMEVFYVSPAAV